MLAVSRRHHAAYADKVGEVIRRNHPNSMGTAQVSKMHASSNGAGLGICEWLEQFGRPSDVHEGTNKDRTLRQRQTNAHPAPPPTHEFAEHHSVIVSTAQTFVDADGGTGVVDQYVLLNTLTGVAKKLRFSRSDHLLPAKTSSPTYTSRRLWAGLTSASSKPQRSATTHARFPERGLQHFAHHPFV